MQTILYQAFNLWPSEDYLLFKPYFFNTLVSVVGTVQIAAYCEGMYLHQRWRVSYTETYTRQGHLHVENNLQRKKLSVESNQIGLQNITMKYKLLDHSSVVVQQDDQTFMVSVPLIAPR